MKIQPNHLYRVLPRLASDGEVKRDGQGCIQHPRRVRRLRPLVRGHGARPSRTRPPPRPRAAGAAALLLRLRRPTDVPRVARPRPRCSLRSPVVRPSCGRGDEFAVSDRSGSDYATGKWALSECRVSDHADDRDGGIDSRPARAAPRGPRGGRVSTHNGSAPGPTPRCVAVRSERRQCGYAVTRLTEGQVGPDPTRPSERENARQASPPSFPQDCPARPIASRCATSRRMTDGRRGATNERSSQ
jgi:hypothetical protein